MELISIIFVIFLAQTTYGLPTTTVAPEDITTQKVLIQTTTLAEIKIQCLNNSCNDPQVQRSGKKELDNPSKIIDLHKDDNDGKGKSHEVSGRKGVDPSTDVVTEMTNDHVQDLHNLKETTMTSTSTTTTTTSSTTTGAPEVKSDEALDKEEVVNDNTPRTSLLVGVILGCTLLCVLIFVGFKRLDAIRRRREYRRMNDFLIDGMYNEM
eukprot:13708.XXX_865492_864812_1 [CDS] Oithona nana genome sequencing.